MNEDTREELADFLRFCRSERRLAAMTCAAYERDVSACLEYLQGKGIGLAEVRVTHLRAFLAEEQERRPAVSPGADNRGAEVLLPLPCRGGANRPRLGAAAADAEEAGGAARHVDDERARAPPRTARARRSLGAPLPGQAGARSAAARLMAYGGLRRGELVGLDWDDVDLSRRLLRIRKAKGGQQRTIPIHQALAPLFAEYYATRLPLTEQAVFVGVQGNRLHYTQLGQVFRHYVDAAGVNERNLRIGAAPRGRQPAPNSGASRPQAPRLDAALHARDRTRTPRRDQAAAVGRLTAISGEHETEHAERCSQVGVVRFDRGRRHRDERARSIGCGLEDRPVEHIVSEA
jgi:integrase/recombinase XerC